MAFFFLDLQLHDARGMLDHFGDVTRPNFAENMFNDLDNSDEPVSLFVELRTRKKNNKLEQLEKGGGKAYSENTRPCWVNLGEQKGGRTIRFAM